MNSKKNPIIIDDNSRDILIIDNTKYYPIIILNDTNGSLPDKSIDINEDDFKIDEEVTQSHEKELYKKPTISLKDELEINKLYESLINHSDSNNDTDNYKTQQDQSEDQFE